VLISKFVLIFFVDSGVCSAWLDRSDRCCQIHPV